MFGERRSAKGTTHTHSLNASASCVSAHDLLPSTAVAHLGMWRAAREHYDRVISAHITALSAGEPGNHLVEANMRILQEFLPQVAPLLGRRVVILDGAADEERRHGVAVDFTFDRSSPNDPNGWFYRVEIGATFRVDDELQHFLAECSSSDEPGKKPYKVGSRWCLVRACPTGYTRT